MEFVLQTHGLCKHYRHCRALDGLTMRVPQGAIYGFVGKNGAGKTTLIRLLCGLQFPTAGSFTLFGRENTDRAIPHSRRRMGAVVESPALYPSLSAEENLRQQYRLLGLPAPDDLPARLAQVGLDDAGRKRSGDFSLGMRQRLGIALALAGDPDFLVLDEPTNGLDPQGIIEMRELLLRLNREQQITMLISSHLLDELARLATHYGFIDGGRLVQELSAAEWEAACRRRVRLQVTDARALARVLDAMQVEYKLLSDTEADVFARLNISRLAIALAEQGGELLGVQEHDESLESYYIHLVGGDRHGSTASR